MSGHFALGETDPAGGRKAGRAAGTQLAMHATILIDDLDKFIAERDHPGRIAGNIDFAPFGTGHPRHSRRLQSFLTGGTIRR